MLRGPHVIPSPQTEYDRRRRLRHTVLYRLDGPWGLPAWYTLDAVVLGVEGAPQLPGRLTGLMVGTLVSAGLVAEGPEICLDGSCMYKVRQYALTPKGHVALAQSFVRDTGLWTDDDTKATAARAAKRAKLT